MKVLIVDDDVDSCEMLELALRLKGIESVFAHSGKKALVALQLHADFDVLLLDLKLPDTSGVGLVLAARSLGLSIPPVVLFSAFSPARLEEACRVLQTTTFIHKPCSIAHLISTMQGVMEGQTVVPGVLLEMTNDVRQESMSF